MYAHLYKDGIMYVLVQHDISRPADFWGPVESLQLPPGLKLHHTFSSEDGSRAVCLWEGVSVKRVEEFIENAVGKVSRNEYYQVPNREGVTNPTLTKESSRA